MLGVERKKEIIRLITLHDSVEVSDLAQQFEVTEETIRKDLKQLEYEGHLKRIYGGAIWNGSVQSKVDIELREKILVPDKEKIADVCAPLINNQESVFLDGSTTSYHIAKKLMCKNITVITNSLLTGNLLSTSSNVKLILLGGTFNPKEQMFLGKTTALSMKQYFVDKAFISCHSLHLEHGITDANEEHAQIRKLGIEHSHVTYLVADHTKFDNTSFSFIAGLNSVHALATNRPLAKEWLDKLNALGVQYLYPANTDEECN